MTSRILRIATRESPLALWQANHIRKQLQGLHPKLRIELLPMSTSGDKFLKDKLQKVGGKGLFVKELEEALLDKRADFAVHSAKDMLAEFPQGLCLTAICTRDNPLDAFVSPFYPNLDALPAQAIVGTSSLRRAAQLLAYRPDLCIQSLRGNINTRLERLQSGAFQAIILATSGLERMGFQHHISQQLSPEIMLPACGQGALAIECRTDDLEIKSLISELNDPISSLCVHTERLVNAQLGGNCHVPIAIFCVPNAPHQLTLHAKVFSPSGDRVISNSQTGSFEEANQLAMLCAQSLFAQGAAELLASIPR